MNKNELFALVFVLALGLGTVACLEMGRRLARSAPEEAGKEGLGVIDGAIFALLGLLVAFTFSGAAARFEDRRHLIVEEANDIGTAYLRIDLLPAEAQPEIRDLFRRYLDARLATYQHVSGLDLRRSYLAKSQDLQAEIWSKSVAASQQKHTTTAGMLLLPALNAMIDITTVRTAATENHPPKVIFAMLALIALASSLMAGYEMSGAKRRRWLHTVGYAVILSIAVYVILDLEYPRLGLIRVDVADHFLVEVRNTMK